MIPTIRRSAGVLTAIGLWLLVGASNAQSTPQAALAAVLGAYTDLEPLPRSLGLDTADAAEVQRMVVIALGPRLGEVAGYKAALTSAGAQARFGVDEPVSGVLLDNMFTATGATVSRDAAVRPVLEADLLVRVGDERINDADSVDAVLASISEIIPFVEIPDLMFADISGLTGADITAINAGARLGVTGQPVSLEGLDDVLSRLRTFTVTLTDGDGQVLGGGRGDALMGHPLAAALWLKNDLARRGVRLETGDLLSLGSLGPPISLMTLERVTAVYEGLARQPIEIHVGFR